MDNNLEPRAGSLQYFNFHMPITTLIQRVRSDVYHNLFSPIRFEEPYDKYLTMPRFRRLQLDRMMLPK